MALLSLSENFRGFFGRLNPSPGFVARASSEHTTIIGLIEDRTGPAAELAPVCFLQGSYKQDTAIYTINDVDIVALCKLWWPPAPGSDARSYRRDDIFRIIASSLMSDGRYRDKVRYGPTSMCIKVDLGIKVEILPVVFKSGNRDPAVEPFILYRPSALNWAEGYARYHQQWLTDKNQRCAGNFVPAIKVIKHLRSQAGLNVASFHIECLLYSLQDRLYQGGPGEYVPNILRAIATFPANSWYLQRISTPCSERVIFTAEEWGADSWGQFHAHVVWWSQSADRAAAAPVRERAIAEWKALLGDQFFPG